MRVATGISAISLRDGYSPRTPSMDTRSPMQTGLLTISGGTRNGVAEERASRDFACEIGSKTPCQDLVDPSSSFPSPAPIVPSLDTPFKSMNDTRSSIPTTPFLSTPLNPKDSFLDLRTVNFQQTREVKPLTTSSL